MSLRILFLVLVSLGLSVGCSSSSKLKERKDQREKAMSQSRLYCEFINGEIYPDLDVALNLEMAKRCDVDKPFSISDYKTPTETPGIMYCCATLNKSAGPSTSTEKNKSVDKKDDAKESSAGN
jgi:hypothetical protein